MSLHLVFYGFLHENNIKYLGKNSEKPEINLTKMCIVQTDI